MSQLLSLKTAHSPSIKAWVKINLGWSLANLFPARAAHLHQSPTNDATSRLDRLVMAFLRDRARIGNDTRFFEALHQDFWKGKGGAVFSSNCDHRFDDIFIKLQRTELTQLRNAWDAGRYRHIVEVGCSSGRLLQYLTTSLPAVSSAIGIDLNKAQIEANRRNREFDERIEFLCTDGFEYVCRNARPMTLFVTNGGVLEYFSRAKLDQMLSHVRDTIGECLFFTVEPVAPDHDWSTCRESIPFGEELSFSHNYRDVFQSNGFELLHQRSVDFESWRWMASIAKAPQRTR